MLIFVVFGRRDTSGNKTTRREGPTRVAVGYTGLVEWSMGTTAGARQSMRRYSRGRTRVRKADLRRRGVRPRLGGNSRVGSAGRLWVVLEHHGRSSAERGLAPRSS